MNDRERLLISDEEKWYLSSMFRKYYDGLFLCAARLTRRQEVAKDIVQDAFEKLLTSKKRFDDEEGIKAFLYTAVRNACIDFIRHEKVVRRNEPLLAEQWDTTSTEAAQERVSIELEVMQELRTRIEALPEDQRRVAVEALLKGRSSRAVAAILGIKYHRVRYIKNRLIKALQHFVREKKGRG